MRGGASDPPISDSGDEAIAVLTGCTTSFTILERGSA
jgi:hypothetical protein